MTYVITQPCIGAKENGVIGAVSGFGKGVAGLPLKFLAGRNTPSIVSARLMDFHY